MPSYNENYTLLEISLGNIFKCELLEISKKGTSIEIGGYYTINSLEDLFKTLKKNWPLIIHFSGDGIVNKKMNSGSNYAKKLFFGADPLDFYLLELIQKDNAYVSFGRKNLIDPYLKEIKNKGFYVYNYSLGPFVSISFQRLTGMETFSFSKYELYFSNTELVNYKEIGDAEIASYSIGKESIKNSLIPVFSTFLNFLNPPENLKIDKSSYIEDKKKLKQGDFFKTLSVSALVFFLLSLLISYGVIEYYNQQYIEYEEQLFYLNDTYSKVKSLEREREKKNAIIKESNLISERFITSYLFEIGSSVPDHLFLKSLSYNPILRKIKSSEPVQLQKDIIHISGVTRSSQELNTWIQDLKTMNWVKNIEILNFMRNREDKLEFDIKIEYK